MNKCLICEDTLKITSLKCNSCTTTYQGIFEFSRLARLNSQEQKLAEELIICEGNLKNLATVLNTTYPTLKKKITALSKNLQKLKENDEKKIEQTLEKVEKKEITPQEGLKIIKELNYEL